ncbi:hypothetical protein ACFLYD_02435 [Chloroflexota bacterium]
MTPRTIKQSVVWGGVLILAGLLLLVNQFIELSPWVWVLMLAAAGLGALGLYLTDRSDWAMLLATYVLWAIALLLVLVTLDILRDDAIAVFVLLAIALPFLGVFLRNRAQWWALIPAYVLLVIGVMIGLLALGVLNDLLVAAYVLFAIAIPFFVVYARDRKLWWALIPGGVLAVVGLSLFVAESAFVYIGAALLFLAGIWILVRAFARGESAPDEHREEHVE